MRKKLFSMILCVIMVICFMPSVAFADTTVIKISSAEELAKIGVEAGYPLNGNYELTTDITLSGNWTPIGAGTRSSKSYTGNAFTGIFDGKNHTISGLTITSVAEGTSVDYALGLFGVVSGGTVKNLTLADVNISVTTSELAGGAVGLVVNGGTVDNVSVSGTVAAKEASGGIVGRMIASGTISNCTNNATVSGTAKNVGGIVGAAYYTETGKVMTISSCTNNGKVSGTGTAFGGIAGLSAADVKNCVNNGSVNHEGNNTSIGGIVGDQYNYGTIEGCINKGTITNNGTGYGTGGIVGWVRYPGDSTNYQLSEKIVVKNNTNIGNITGGNDGGGIIGTLYNAGEVTGNINLAKSISSVTFAAGIVGNIQKPNSDPWKTELKQLITITGNATSTDINSITATGTAKCTGEIAYNNLGEAAEGVSIANNTYKVDAKVYLTKTGKYQFDDATHSSGYNTWTLNTETGIYEESYVYSGGGSSSSGSTSSSTGTSTGSVVNTTETKTDGSTSGTTIVPETKATVAAETKTAEDGTKTTTATVDTTVATQIVEMAVENKSEEVIIAAAETPVVETAVGTTTEVAIPAEAVSQIAEKTAAAVTIESGAAKVTLDQKAVAAVAEAAGETGNVSLVVETKAQDENKVEVELKLETSSGKISDFKGGSVSVTVKLNSALADKTVACVYIDDNGNYHKVAGQKNADGTFTFTTGHFSTYAIMSEEEADAVIASQTEKVKKLLNNTSIKVRSAKTAKGNIKVTLKVNKKNIKAIEDLGYTITYKFSRSSKASGAYKAKAEKAIKTYTDKTGKKGTKYYYKARVMVYDTQGTLIAKTSLKQCKYAARVK